MSKTEVKVGQEWRLRSAQYNSTLVPFAGWWSTPTIYLIKELDLDKRKVMLIGYCSNGSKIDCYDILDKHNICFLSPNWMYIGTPVKCCYCNDFCKQRCKVKL